LFFILQVVGFYFFGMFATIVLSVIFYSYVVDRCSLYVLPLSILPMPVVIIPLIFITGMGNFAGLTMFYSVLWTTGIFSVLTFAILFFMNKRKYAREDVSK